MSAVVANAGRGWLDAFPRGLMVGGLFHWLFSSIRWMGLLKDKEVKILDCSRTVHLVREIIFEEI